MENFFIYAATGTEDNVKLATLVREWLENSSVSRMTLVVVGELGVTAHPVGEYMNGAAYFDFPNTTQKKIVIDWTHAIIPPLTDTQYLLYCKTGVSSRYIIMGAPESPFKNLHNSL